MLLNTEAVILSLLEVPLMRRFNRMPVIRLITLVIRFEGFEPGNPAEIEGRKVRVVEGVTIERVVGK
jgi:hypothetical protein